MCADNGQLHLYFLININRNQFVIIPVLLNFTVCFEIGKHLYQEDLCGKKANRQAIFNVVCFVIVGATKVRR